MNETKNKIVQNIFSQAYIIGGSPCSGKSTIAKCLANDYNFEYYKVDDHEKEHSKRCQSDRHPVMFKYSKMNWDEIWMRPASYQAHEMIEYYQERFEMIIEDLQIYNLEKPILLEGAAFLPNLVKQFNVNSQKVLFMVPTKEFQLNHYSKRPWIKPILKECKNPEKAFENWMMRDYLFSQEILKNAKFENYHTISINGSENINTIYTKVKKYFDLEINVN